MTRRYVINLDRYMRMSVKDRTRLVDRVQEYLFILGEWLPERKGIREKSPRAQRTAKRVRGKK